MKRNTRMLSLVAGLPIALAACGDSPAAPAAAPVPMPEPRMTVISTSPATGAIGIARAATVSAAFSLAADSTSVHEGSFSLWRESTQVPATVRWSGGRATLTPKGLLDLGTTYTAVLTTDIGSETGVRLSGRYAWDFMTKQNVVP